MQTSNIEEMNEDGFTTVVSNRHRGNTIEGKTLGRMDIREQMNNMYEVLGVNTSSEQIKSLFPQDADSIIQAQIREENLRKEEE